MTSEIRTDPFRGRRQLVTGAAGFIGSHLCAALARRGSAKVHAVDNLLFGDWGNIAQSSRVRAHAIDLRDVDVDGFRELLEGVDVLFHFAAQKLNNATSAEDLIATNVAATYRLFEAAASVGVRKIVFASSLYAHGRTSLPPLREDEFVAPDTLYGVTKWTGEGMLRSIQSTATLDTVALRLFFTYGPRQYVGLGYPSVIVTNFNRMLRGEAPLVNGSGEQRLDYVYIDDVVDAVLRAASSSAVGIVNIGSGHAVSINDLTRVMREVAEFKLPPRQGPADWTDGTHRQADPSKANRALGWRASTPLAEGLANVWHWMQAQEPAC